jgi:cathepsin B
MKLALAVACGVAAVSAAEVHEARLAQIDEIFKQEGVLWTAGVNGRFASEAPGASKNLCGVKGVWKEQVLSAVAEGKVRHFVADGDVAIPDNFDSEEHWPFCAEIIGDIRDQSNCGCCWAFAGAEAASDRMCIATGGKLEVPLSAEDVCFCASEDGCGGGQIDTPWDYIKNSGSVSGGQYRGFGPFGKGMCSDFVLPHCHHHGPQGDDPHPAEGQPGCPIASSPQCPDKCDEEAFPPHADFGSDKYSFDGEIETASGEEDIQRMIMKGGPVETAFTVYSDFENYVGGVYHHVSGEMAGGHAVKFVGWGVDNGVKYWKVANSWNPYWGEKGYFRIARGSNEGGIEDMVTGASASARWWWEGPEAVVV